MCQLWQWRFLRLSPMYWLHRRRYPLMHLLFWWVSGLGNSLQSPRLSSLPVWPFACPWSLTRPSCNLFPSSLVARRRSHPALWILEFTVPLLHCKFNAANNCRSITCTPLFSADAGMCWTTLDGGVKPFIEPESFSLVIVAIFRETGWRLFRSNSVWETHYSRSLFAIGLCCYPIAAASGTLEVSGGDLLGHRSALGPALALGVDPRLVPVGGVLRIWEADDGEPLLVEDQQAEFPVSGSFPMVFWCIHDTLLVFPHTEPYVVRWVQRGELHIVYNVDKVKQIYLVGWFRPQLAGTSYNRDNNGQFRKIVK